MVTLNLTLLIELGLFLLFLWGTNKFILGPTLRLLDERADLITHNEEQREQDENAAHSIEAKFADEMLNVHREAEERFREARRAAMAERSETIAAERATAEDEIRGIRESANELVARQHEEAKALAPQLAEDIAKQLGLEKAAS